MKHKRDFHRQVRVVYRACRRLYGIEKTQDECLRVFKVVFPELHRLRGMEGDSASIPRKVTDRLIAIIHEWNPQSGLKEICERIVDQLQMPFDWNKGYLIRFYEDIMPVAMRIRKLTPSECLKLMDCDDTTIEIMTHCGLSNSALYRLAGNSIVISCMFHTFRKLFVEKEQDIVKGKTEQLMLF